MMRAHFSKIKPGYLSELKHYPNADPIFVAINWPCVNQIRASHGVCLLCNKNCELYDLHFCKEKEVWVLYSQPSELLIAKRLGQSLIRHGARKIVIEPWDKVLRLEAKCYE